MRKSLVNKTIYGLRDALIQRSPEILTAMGVTGLITSVTLAIKATPKAVSIWEDQNLETRDKIVGCARVYAPTIGMCILTAGAIIASNRVSAKRRAAIATLYSISEMKLREYQDKNREILGEEKEKTIRDKVAEDRVQKAYETTEIIYTNRGDTLCFDPMSGRLFKHDIQKIRSAVNDINRQISLGESVSLNEFYWALGLDGTKFGDGVGWTVEAPLDVSYSSSLTSDMKPCLTIDYRTDPFPWFRDL